MQFLEVSGGRLEAAWWGPPPDQAPTLVLLHEGLGCVALWREVPERLAAATGWGIFAYSRFGYGQSDVKPLPWPMHYMHDEARLLPEVLSAAGISRYALIGHSDGGSIAAIHAGAGDTPCHPPAGSPSAVAAAIRDFAEDADAPSTGAVRAVPGGAAASRGGPSALIMIAAHFFVEDLNIASIRRIKADYDHGDLRPRLARYHRNVDVAFRGWNESWLDPRFRAFDITTCLPRIACPVLALQGAEDPYGTDEQLRVLAAHARAPTKTRLIPGARHAPHLEAKDATLAAIGQFVAHLHPATEAT